MLTTKVLTRLRFLPLSLVSTIAIRFQLSTFCISFIHSNFNLRPCHMFSPQDPYKVVLVVIYSNSNPRITKNLDFLLILSYLKTPYPTSIVCTESAYAFHVRCISVIALQTILSWKHTLWTLIRLRPSSNWSGSILRLSKWWY